MSKKIPLLVTTLSLFLLSGCTLQSGVVTVAPSPQSSHKPTPEEAKAYCEQKGGHYETWKDEDGSSNIFCILPQGYGCDPMKFIEGSCGLN